MHLLLNYTYIYACFYKYRCNWYVCLYEYLAVWLAIAPLAMTTKWRPNGISGRNSFAALYLHETTAKATKEKAKIKQKKNISEYHIACLPHVASGK